MEEKALMQKMGMRLKEVRTAKGMSQEELGIKALNGDKTHISRLETGKVNPTLFTLYRLARCLEVTVSDLLDFEDQ